MCETFKKSNVDYFSNTDPRTFPDGLDVSVMTFDSIERANNEAVSEFDKEHVTPYIRNSNHFSKSSIKYPDDLSKLRWTVDEIDDLNVIKNIFNYFSPDIYFNWQQILKLYKTNPKLFSDNNIKTNEGSNIGTGQKLYKRQKNNTWR